MTFKVLQILYNNITQSVSGQSIAETLGISRVAVKKHIDKLIKNGHSIEAVKKSGYKLQLLNDIFDFNMLKLFCGLRNFEADIEFHSEISSTNDRAKQHFGIKDKGVVIAASQLSGRGRMGRNFISPKGGVYVSYYSKPASQITPYDAVKMVIVTAVAVIDTCNYFGINAKIKWANDIFYGTKKICGILCEMSCESERVQYILQGVGINVNNTDFDSQISDVATSLRLISGKNFLRAEVASELLKNLKLRNGQFFSGGYKEILTIYKNKCATLGKQVEVFAEKTYQALAVGIDDEGFLEVKTNDGEIKKVLYGDVSVKW